MPVKAILSSVMLFSTSVLSATQHAKRTQLFWGNERNCVGNGCFKLEDSKKTGIFDKLDKADRYLMKEPFVSNDNGNDIKALNFNFND